MQHDDPTPREYNIDDPQFDRGDGPADELQRRIGELEAKLAEADSRALRTLADHQNYVRRAVQNEQVAELRGITQVVQSIVGVVDHFDIALTVDPNRASAQQVIDGVRVIREELLKALAKIGVTVVSPAANEEFRPGMHEAIMQQSSPGVESGRIASTFQPGYLLGDRLIRPAKVAVAP